MFDALLCYGFAVSIIRAGYLGLVADLLRQASGSCRQIGAAAIGFARRRASAAAHLRRADDTTLRRLARLETYVTSMT